MTTDCQCPTGCEPGSSSNQIEKRTSASLQIDPRMAHLAALEPNELLFLCPQCMLVWRNRFDTYILQYRIISLGHYSDKGFEPAEWLKAEARKSAECP